MITTVISIVKTITFICLKENNNTGKVRGKNVKFRYAGFGALVGHTWAEKAKQVLDNKAQIQEDP